MRRFLILLLAALPGCAPAGRLIRAAGEAWMPVPSVNRLALVVDGCGDAARCAELRRALVGVLTNGFAERVVDGEQPAELRLRVAVTADVRPGTAARLLGATADAERLDAVVTVTDLRGAPPRVLRRFAARGEAPVHPWRPEAGRQDALDGFAGDVADGLRF